jgi:hypothetical protein
MLCPRCHGTHVVLINGQRLPCPECAGMGELHCCDGLQEQPGQEAGVSEQDLDCQTDFDSPYTDS